VTKEEDDMASREVQSEVAVVLWCATMVRATMVRAAMVRATIVREARVRAAMVTGPLSSR